MLAIVWAVTNVAFQQRADRALWADIETADKSFAQMALNYGEVLKQSHGPHDIFVNHLAQEVRRLATRIQEASEKQDLRIAADYIVNVDGVFDAFNSSGDKTLRMTWSYTVGEKLFQAAAERRFFEVMMDMLSQGKFNDVRFLVLYDEEAKEDATLCKFCAFIRSHDGFDGRMILKPTFKELIESNDLPPNAADMAIYGNRMLFYVEQATPRYSGVYIKDEGRVAGYRRFFDEAWESEGLSCALLDTSACAPITYGDIKDL